MFLLNPRGIALILSFTFLPLTIWAQEADPTPAASPKPVPEGISVLHDVVMGKGGDVDLHAEIAYPTNATTPMTAVIYVHGGGWLHGSQKDSPIIRLARAGFFAASIEYRLSNVAKWPAQIQDCKLGVRWLRANAAQYHIDPDHIGAWGASAGGHLVTCLATMTDVKDYEGTGGYPGVSSSVQAVVDFFGPTNFTDPTIYTPAAMGLTQGLFGVSLRDNPELWKSGSPLFYVKAGMPPVLMVHGDSDKLVPLAQSIAFDTALTQVGVPHELLVVKNANHGFTPTPGTTIDPNNAAINKAVVDFFDKYLKAPEKPSESASTHAAPIK